MNVDHTPVECILQDFYAGDYVDKLDVAKVNHDERMVIANAGAWGLGRKTAEMLIAQADQTSSFVRSFARGLPRTLLPPAVEALEHHETPAARRFGKGCVGPCNYRTSTSTEKKKNR